jgi:membrane-bound serine protease (ClpP class)
VKIAVFEILLDPNIAYLLLVAGFLAALLSLFSPGTGIGEAGALLLLILAGYAAVRLTVNLWALALLILGVFPFIIAVLRSGNRIYLLISIAAFVIGSAFLFRGEGLAPAVNPVLALLVSTLTTVFIWVMTLQSLEARQQPPTHDLQALIGAIGEARTDIHEDGTVQVAGELWSAYSREPIPLGVKVRVVGREGFKLLVEPEKPDAP